MSGPERQLGNTESIGDLIGRPPRSVPLRRRPWWTRVSGAHVAMVLAGVVALLLNLSLLRDDGLIEVATFRGAVEPGSSLAASMVEWVELESTSDLSGPLVTRQEIEVLLGRVVSAPMAPGDLLVESLLRIPAAPAELRSISIPVDPAHAVGGSVAVGDLVDVIATENGIARFVAVGAPVLAVPSAERRGITGGNSYFVVVAVDADTALRLAQAVDSGSIDVVVSTGAPPPTAVTLPSGQEG